MRQFTSFEWWARASDRCDFAMGVRGLTRAYVSAVTTYLMYGYTQEIHKYMYIVFYPSEPNVRFLVKPDVPLSCRQRGTPQSTVRRRIQCLQICSRMLSWINNLSSFLEAHKWKLSSGSGENYSENIWWTSIRNPTHSGWGSWNPLCCVLKTFFVQGHSSKLGVYWPR